MQTLANGTAPHKEISWGDFTTGNLPPHSPHIDLFRQAVSQAAATMDTPPYNDDKGKLTKAMDLVLENKVQPHTDGLWTVQGSTKPYELDGECPCPQGQRAASKWCKHMVAVELWKRAQERLSAAGGNGDQSRYGDSRNGNGKLEPTLPPEPEPIPAIADDCAKHWTDVLAPICHTVKYVVDGIEHVTVIRGDDMTEVMAQVKELTATIKKGREAETVPTEDIPFCNAHNVYFERHSNAKGSWYSHKTSGGWCRYSGKQ